MTSRRRVFLICVLLHIFARAVFADEPEQLSNIERKALQAVMQEEELLLADVRRAHRMLPGDRIDPQTWTVVRAPVQKVPPIPPTHPLAPTKTKADPPQK